MSETSIIKAIDKVREALPDNSDALDKIQTAVDGMEITMNDIYEILKEMKGKM